MWKKINLDPYLIPYTKLNSKCIIALNVEATTVKFLEVYVGENFTQDPEDTNHKEEKIKFHQNMKFAFQKILFKFCFSKFAFKK